MIGESYYQSVHYNYSYLNCLRQTKHIQLVNYKDFWVTPSIMITERKYYLKTIWETIYVYKLIGKWGKYIFYMNQSVLNM